MPAPGSHSIEEKYARNFEAFEAKMAQDNAPDIVLNGFRRYFNKFLLGEQSYLREKDILPIREAELTSFDELGMYKDKGVTSLSKTVIIKLNGGLGTSMGLDGPKSFLPVREGRTFLDLILGQVGSMRKEFDAALPLVLMNSFWTDEPTRERLFEEGNGDPNIPLSFVQHRYPRILADSFTPLVMNGAPEYEWNPPGHGDIFNSLLTTGMLRRLLLLGYRYAFVSNSDNLGAVFSPEILGFMTANRIPFLMEVCERTKLDRKGGHLMRHKDGTLGLREVAQCAPEELSVFQDYNKHAYFNTNSIWIDLKEVENAFLKYRNLSLELIVNPKKAIPGDPSSPDVIQLETAMGAAISLFDGADAVVVPRTRFAPVKTISDLMLTMSDCYEVTDGSQIICNTHSEDLPSIHLDPSVYSTIKRFFARFPDGVPSLAKCKELSIEGDVCISGSVEMSGKVKIVNNSARQAIIPNGRCLSGELTL